MTTARIDEQAEALIIAGTGRRPAVAELVGPRARVEAPIGVDGENWEAKLPLQASRWGGAELPLPTGEYQLRIDDVDLSALLVAPTVLSGLRIAVDGDTVHINAPIAPVYESFEGQATLEGRYANQSGGTENAVFFESFYGRSVGCNPRAIDRELAARAPQVRRYWSVVDLSVAVPEGAIAVVEGSPEWWHARGAARLLVVNDWLRRRFVRKPGQKVLQTWHGTPLKRLALHRPGFDPRRMAAVVKESRRWDLLLVQNIYAERILRKAYAFFGRPIWVDGYPRNDALATGDPAAIRGALGIGREERVLLYAPTWRDDRTEMVDFIDPESLARQADAVVLVRGHSRTLEQGRDRAGARVIDVTGYPETTQLLLAADALITDYSSVMFDFSVTGKPMYFLVPDLDHYRGELRGFYFDLAERAPGPLVQTQEELAAALADDGHEARYATRYAAWRAQFNRLDDGHAAERVVDRILDLGFVTP
ncbi:MULTISPECIES: CDP-glycerol glycerophosphotransferase family protein [unclassified Microbacterium]|uniref:CDP-glycerol glycerophosphotransferase family protein n=1 Tax=unclassified Microbacterium TaxID=2609290 RepID=UPI000EA88D18|nr:MULTISPECIES: CDP-glycerol glycerophosphotransferase family protein [unclassified Microbacterium]MBT2485367.1 CDP-glycerol glycerophosphotransferase family protein [Microbacterium sp. ISL-108]RKN68171.1 glycosyl/glycerophosphate transferase [Microbacterium sp. CGR2]